MWTYKMEDYKFLFKVVLVGNAGVGKTCLVRRFTQGMFPPGQGATIGVDFKVKTVNVNASKVTIHRNKRKAGIEIKMILVKFFISTCIIIIGEAGDLGHCWSRKIPNIDA